MINREYLYVRRQSTQGVSQDGIYEKRGVAYLHQEADCQVAGKVWVSSSRAISGCDVLLLEVTLTAPVKFVLEIEASQVVKEVKKGVSGG